MNMRNALANEKNIIDSRNWVAINYYLNKEKILCQNLANQDFDFFLPKISIIKNDRQSMIDLFPGYGFVYVSQNELAKLKYTRGVKNALIPNADCPQITNDFVLDLKRKCSKALSNPLLICPSIGDIVEVNKGVFKGSLAKVVSLKPNQRIELLINILSKNIKIDFDVKSIKQIA